MEQIMQNCVCEISFKSSIDYCDPFTEIELDVVFECTGQAELVVPAFWSGTNIWKARFSSQAVGCYAYRTICSDTKNKGLHDIKGKIEVTPYTGTNLLYKHGPLQKSENGRYLEHTDGTPFFWLGDTWWMGLVSRFKWPQDFQFLVSDRVNKGFSVIQIVAGLYPSLSDNPWDHRSANEAGWAWEKGYERINPYYFDKADERIRYLVESGLVPCIFAMWGDYMDLMGLDKVKKHWRNLVARWGAYPVVWSLGGELLLYTFGTSGDRVLKRKADWTVVGRYLRKIDPYKRPVTAHPIRDDSRRTLDDESIIDIDMLQTGHAYTELEQTVRSVKRSIDKTPPMPVINGEVCYEGIHGTCWQDVQRFCFWTSLLSGSAGHTYGSAAIHCLQTKEEKQVHDEGFYITDSCWEEDYNLPGSKQVGIGRKFLERFAWWRFQRRVEPDWIAEFPEVNDMLNFAAGIPNEVWLIYIPSHSFDSKFSNFYRMHPFEEKRNKMYIEPGTEYTAYFFNPRNGSEIGIGKVAPKSGNMWEVPLKPTGEDWVLVLENKK